MKKIFVLSDDKIKTARLIEAVKYEVKKYLKREQKKTLPENADYWDFDCRYGQNEKEARPIHQKEINKCLDEAEAQELKSFYLEIMAKPAARRKKPDTNI